MIDESDILLHFGVKGMRWGVRKDASGIRRTLTGKPAASTDFETAKGVATKLRKGGVKSLSNAEIKQLNERMQLEQQLGTLQANQPNKFRRGHAVVKEVLSVGQTGVGIFNLVNSPATKAGAGLIKGVINKSTGK